MIGNLYITFRKWKQKRYFKRAEVTLGQNSAVDIPAYLSYCDIYENVRIAFNVMAMGQYQDGYGNMRRKKIIIKQHAFIGYGSWIKEGITIGKGAIVAPNSVVLRDVPDYCLVAGNPALIKKELK